MCIRDSFWGEGVEWVGLYHFKRFIEGKYFARLIRNTLVLSGLNLLFGFTAPILFALLIEMCIRDRLINRVEKILFITIPPPGRGK